MYQNELEFFRSTRARTLAMVEGLSQAQMDFLPAPGRWSVGELLDHLILSETITRRDISELIQLKKTGRQPVIYRSSTDFDIAPVFIPKSMLPFLEIPFNFFNMFMPNNVREFFLRYALIPARHARAATPRRQRSADELHQELLSSLSETETLFAANPTLDYREMILQHPLLGTNNVLQLLRMLALHEQRHQSQMADILKSPQFPRAIRMEAKT